jgi:cytoskeletal protein CcmA (bactofilin family)
MFNRESRAPSRIDMLIGASAKVHGDVEFCGGLHVEGHVFGAVRAYGDEESTVSVGDSGVIERGVKATHVVVNGIVRGNVEATGKVVLGPTAEVLGNVEYGTIESATGAQITGRLVPVKPTAQQAPERAPEAAKG